MCRRSSLVVRTVGVAGGLLAATALAAPASAEPRPTPLAEGLLSPLSVAQGDDGTVWFTQNYAGTLERRDPDGDTAVVARASGDLELAGVTEEDGTVWYAVSGRGHTVGRLHRLDPDGTDGVVADLYAHERDTNPDAGTTYGFRDLPPRCAARLPEDDGRAVRKGPAETHPYNLLRAHGAVYVADAAANAITAVAGQDVATTVAVLPAVRTTMSAAYAEENGLPACSVGRDYWAEAVPTDVEPGPDGSLYVTTLPGGPGAVDGEPAGQVLRILILTGQISVVASGLDNPTGLAVSDGGDLYVCELQADRISRIAAGTGVAQPFASQIFPGDVEWTPDGLLATIDVLSGTDGVDPPAGEVVRLN